MRLNARRDLILKHENSNDTKVTNIDHRIAYLADYPDYAEEVAWLKYKHWRHTSPDRPYELWAEEIRHSARKRELPLTFIALKPGELLGFVTLVEIMEKVGIDRGVWLITLYVKAPYRGAGLGLRLVERCLLEARELGYSALHLWTESARLTDYYARSGWRWFGRDDECGQDIMMYEIVHFEDRKGAT